MEPNDPFWQTCVWLFGPAFLAAAVYVIVAALLERWTQPPPERGPWDEDDEDTES